MSTLFWLVRKVVLGAGLPVSRDPGPPHTGTVVRHCLGHIATRDDGRAADRAAWHGPAHGRTCSRRFSHVPAATAAAHEMNTHVSASFRHIPDDVPFTLMMLKGARATSSGGATVATLGGDGGGCARRALYGVRTNRRTYGGPDEWSCETS